MQNKISKRRKPTITLGRTDHERLSNLVRSAAARLPDAADALLSELERAVLVADKSVRPNVVRMGSAVEYETDAGGRREITLVFPGDADISQGKVSVLTPIGTALLGLSEGQRMTWTARDGRDHELTIVKVDGGGSFELAQRPGLTPALAAGA